MAAAKPSQKQFLAAVFGSTTKADAVNLNKDKFLPEAFEFAYKKPPYGMGAKPGPALTHDIVPLPLKDVLTCTDGKTRVRLVGSNAGASTERIACVRQAFINLTTYIHEGKVPLQPGDRFQVSVLTMHDMQAMLGGAPLPPVPPDVLSALCFKVKVQSVGEKEYPDTQKTADVKKSIKEKLFEVAYGGGKLSAPAAKAALIVRITKALRAGHLKMADAAAFGKTLKALETHPSFSAYAVAEVDESGKVKGPITSFGAFAVKPFALTGLVGNANGRTYPAHIWEGLVGHKVKNLTPLEAKKKAYLDSLGPDGGVFCLHAAARTPTDLPITQELPPLPLESPPGSVHADVGFDAAHALTETLASEPPAKPGVVLDSLAEVNDKTEDYVDSLMKDADIPEKRKATVAQMLKNTVAYLAAHKDEELAKTATELAEKVLSKTAAPYIDLDFKLGPFPTFTEEAAKALKDAPPLAETLCSNPVTAKPGKDSPWFAPKGLKLKPELKALLAKVHQTLVDSTAGLLFGPVPQSMGAVPSPPASKLTAKGRETLKRFGVVLVE